MKSSLREIAIILSQGPGLPPVMCPFVIRDSKSYENNYPVWLEYWPEAKFDKKKALSEDNGMRPSQNLQEFKSLPVRPVTVMGRQYIFYDAVCQRVPGRVRKFPVESGGWIWTIWPDKKPKQPTK